MAVTHVGSAGNASGNSVALPAHQTGDLLVVYAYRSSNSTPPTVPAGWTSAFTQTPASASNVIAFKEAASNADVSGTWTNATAIAVSVWRGADTTQLGFCGSAGGGTSANQIFSAGSPTIIDGSAGGIAFSGRNDGTTTATGGPTGYTEVVDETGTDAITVWVDEDMTAMPGFTATLSGSSYGNRSWAEVLPAGTSSSAIFTLKQKAHVRTYY
jgi:hypothetical protein